MSKKSNEMRTKFSDFVGSNFEAPAEAGSKIAGCGSLAKFFSPFFFFFFCSRDEENEHRAMVREFWKVETAKGRQFYISSIVVNGTDQN